LGKFNSERRQRFKSTSNVGLLVSEATAHPRRGNSKSASSVFVTHFTAAQSSGCGSPDKILQMKNFRWTDFSG
jgi:hypothetical protein